MKLLLLLACGSMLYLGTAGFDGSDPDSSAALAAATESTTKATAPAVPEPSTMLFAGLGGITLLMFAIRRK